MLCDNKRHILVSISVGIYLSAPGLSQKEEEENVPSYVKRRAKDGTLLCHICDYSSNETVENAETSMFTEMGLYLCKNETDIGNSIPCQSTTYFGKILKLSACAYMEFYYKATSGWKQAFHRGCTFVGRSFLPGCFPCPNKTALHTDTKVKISDYGDEDDSATVFNELNVDVDFRTCCACNKPFCNHDKRIAALNGYQEGSGAKDATSFMNVGVLILNGFAGRFW